MAGEEVFPRDWFFSGKLNQVDLESVLVESGLDQFYFKITDLCPGAEIGVVAPDQGMDGGGIFAVDGFVDDGPAKEGIFASPGFGGGGIGSQGLILGGGGKFIGGEEG